VGEKIGPLQAIFDLCARLFPKFPVFKPLQRPVVALQVEDCREKAGAFVQQQIIWVKDRGALTRSHSSCGTQATTKSRRQWVGRLPSAPLAIKAARQVSSILLA